MVHGLRRLASALQRSDAPIRLGTQLRRDGVQGLERALDRWAVGGGLGGQEANPPPRDIESAEPPASPPVDELARLDEERASSRAVAGGQLRVRERCQDAWLVPERGASMASERECPLEPTPRRVKGAVLEFRGGEKRRGLHLGEHASVLFRERDGAAAVSQRAGQIAPQAPDLAEEGVRSSAP